MNDQHLARLEAQLERLIEGAFTQLFSKTIRAQDIALQLARAMEDNAQRDANADPRPLAPDMYIIRMNTNAQESLLKRQPALAQILGQHMVELATHTGYRLDNVPIIQIEAVPGMGSSELEVKASHTERPQNSTAVMQRIETPLHENTLPTNPQLIVNGQCTIPLKLSLVNIGRSQSNDVVIDDPHISRHHAQLRLRFGRYTLFDTDSHGGTFVNDVRVREHRLQPGDVIRMGKTQIVYLEDDSANDSQTWAHTSLNP